jgi:arylsulfatase A-like enzyme
MRQSKSILSARTVLLGIGLLMTCAVAARAQATAPNVILAMADDMGWGDPAYNGNTVIKTPNLDAMARAGIRFDRFYAPTVCSPTRGSCMTGRHPYRYGITNANVGHLPLDETTIAEALRTRGYATGHFGKWHLGTLTKTEKDANRGGGAGAADYAPPWDHGFDVTFSTESRIPTWDPMWRPPNPGMEPPAWDAIADKSQARPFGTAYWSNGKRVTEDLDGDDSKLIMDRALRFIGEATAHKKPFLAVIWFHAPHLPVVAGPQYAALYPGATVYERNYYGSITALDDQMGRLRAELRRLGVADNTMLWFCSDNGPEGQAGKAPGSAGPFRGRKRDLWEGGIRVPGLLEWPAVVKEPKVVNAPCVTSDLLPTVIDCLGLPRMRPQPYDGISLRPIIAGEMTQRSQPIGFEYGNMAAWLDNRYKLVALLKDAPSSDARAPRKEITKVLLFEVSTDPREERELSTENPDTVKTMLAALEAWRASCLRSRAGADYR